MLDIEGFGRPATSSILRDLRAPLPLRTIRRHWLPPVIRVTCRHGACVSGWLHGIGQVNRGKQGCPTPGTAVVDLDDLIEKQDGRKIQDIFRSPVRLGSARSNRRSWVESLESPRGSWPLAEEPTRIRRIEPSSMEQESRSIWRRRLKPSLSAFRRTICVRCFQVANGFVNSTTNGWRPTEWPL